nr:MAG TPA: hypothetical protein [Caudoviricetes sp.]
MTSSDGDVVAPHCTERLITNYFKPTLIILNH